MRVETITLDIPEVNWQAFILEEIANPVMKRKQVAQTYRILIEQEESQQPDWHTINAAIVARWSKSALIWIKREAWRQRGENYVYL